MQGYQTTQHPFIQHPKVTQTIAPGSQNVQRQQTVQRLVQNPGDGRCYNCGERRHFASACPKPCNHPNQTPTTNAVPNQNGNPTPVAGWQNFVHGRVNHVTVDGAQEAPDVVLGMFSVNNTTSIVLFDSGVSHSFISAAYVERHNILVAMLKCRMIVTSPRGDMPARQVCPKVKIILRGGGRV
jgi:hypothetical protein